MASTERALSPAESVGTQVRAKAARQKSMSLRGCCGWTSRKPGLGPLHDSAPSSRLTGRHRFRRRLPWRRLRSDCVREPPLSHGGVSQRPGRAPRVGQAAGMLHPAWGVPILAQMTPCGTSRPFRYADKQSRCGDSARGAAARRRWRRRGGAGRGRRRECRRGPPESGGGDPEASRRERRHGGGDLPRHPVRAATGDTETAPHEALTVALGSQSSRTTSRPCSAGASTRPSATSRTPSRPCASWRCW